MAAPARTDGRSGRTRAANWMGRPSLSSQTTPIRRGAYPHLLSNSRLAYGRSPKNAPSLLAVDYEQTQKHDLAHRSDPHEANGQSLSSLLPRLHRCQHRHCINSVSANTKTSRAEQSCDMFPVSERVLGDAKPIRKGATSLRSREAALNAQSFNNPLTTFRTETFILMVIACDLPIAMSYRHKGSRTIRSRAPRPGAFNWELERLPKRENLSIRWTNQAQSPILDRFTARPSRRNLGWHRRDRDLARRLNLSDRLCR